MKKLFESVKLNFRLQRAMKGAMNRIFVNLVESKREYVHYRFALSARWILKVQDLGKTLKDCGYFYLELEIDDYDSNQIEGKRNFFPELRETFFLNSSLENLLL